MSIAEFPPTAIGPAEATAPARRLTLTLEQAVYIALVVLALVLRLWGLGDRAMHHDETHHANFSWLLYQGRGYIHDPLLHGPFLYHLGALIFFLFGDSNTTARLGVALFGTLLVALPYLIRREIGSGAALLASLYLAFSPVVLYVNRFIRHDSYAVVFELLTLIAIMRYAATRKARWLYIGATALGFMFTNMATFFLYVAIFLPLLVVVLLWRVWRPGILLAALAGLVAVAAVFWLPGAPTTSGTVTVDSRAFLYWLVLVIFLALAGPWLVLSLRRRAFSLPLVGVALVGAGLLGLALLPHAPVQKSGGQVQRANGNYVCPSAQAPYPPDNPMLFTPGPLLGLPPLPTEDNNYALCVRNQYDSNFGVYFAKIGQFFGHPAILLGAGLSLGLLGAVYWLGWRRRDREGQTAWGYARQTADSLLDAFASLGQGRRLLIAFGLFFAIYALLFSAFFSNPTGVVSGATGSLLYWLAQHDVRRGGQPDYFYMVTLSIYEPLLLLWGLVGLTMVGTLVARRLLGLRPPLPDGAIDWGLAGPLLLAWWALGTFAIYSWAGEKMPWLTIRSAVPLTLLGAWALAQTLGWWRRVSSVGGGRRTADGGRRTADEPEVSGDLHPLSDTQDPIPDSQPATRNPQPASIDPALWVYLGLFSVITGLCFILLASVSRPDSGQEAAAPVVPLLGLALIALLSIAAGLLRGWRWALGALAIAVTLCGALGAVRTSYQLNYRWGDVPREMMIYTQTSPDVQRVVDRLTAASIKRGGGMDLPVWYDNETIWSWYMRRFTSGREQGAQLGGTPGEDVMAILMMDENYNNPANTQQLEGFLVQRFPLRWWFPENETYRLPANWATDPVSNDSPLLMRVLRQPLDGRTAAQFWQFMLYRQLPAPLGSSDFILAIRPELAPDMGLGVGSAER